MALSRFSGGYPRESIPGQRLAHTHVYADVSGGTSANQATSGAAGTNDAFIIAAASADGTALTTIAAQPSTSGTPSRNVRVVISSAGGGDLPADCGVVTVVGTDHFGNTVTEAVDLSSLNGITLGAGGVVFLKTVATLASVTSLTPSVDLTSVTADVMVSLGLGTKVGLRTQLYTPAAADVKAVRKGTAAVASSTYVVDTTYHAVEMGADLSDNDDLLIEYDGY